VRARRGGVRRHDRRRRYNESRTLPGPASAYQRRDRVGLIVFQKDRATLVLRPTNSVQLAQRALIDIPVGGKTPLSAGLLMATDVLQHEKYTHPDIEPLLIVLTDRAGNVSIGSLPPQEESYRFAELIATEANANQILLLI